jgi:hypothetical protein
MASTLENLESGRSPRLALPLNAAWRRPSDARLQRSRFDAYVFPEIRGPMQGLALAVQATSESAMVGGEVLVMDPYLVRQQEEAEQEARERQRTLAPVPRTQPLDAPASPTPAEVAPAFSALAAADKGTGRETVPVPSPPGARRAGFLPRLGRLISFAAAGAIAGASAGIAIVEFFKFRAGERAFVIFGAAAIAALACAPAGWRRGR